MYTKLEVSSSIINPDITSIAFWNHDVLNDIRQVVGMIRRLCFYLHIGERGLEYRTCFSTPSGCWDNSIRGCGADGAFSANCANTKPHIVGKWSELAPELI